MADNFQKVFKSPINTSISKNLYSFPKSQRFQNTPQSPQYSPNTRCKRSFYNLKTKAFQTRTTSFGYGNKISLINKEGVPPPGSYDRNSDFQRKRGFSFGNVKRASLADQLDLDNPGPGKYQKVFNNYNRLSYTFRSKYEDPLQRHKNLLGPGQYQAPPAMNSTGNYFNSKYRSSGCGKIGKSSRFEDQSNETPGPGKYNDKLGINRLGTYFNSKVASNYVKSFQGTSRLPINQPSEAPGPGTYYYFSEFAQRSKSGAK